MHASSMDAGLVTFLKEKEFDTASETFKVGAAAIDATLPSCSHHEPGTSCA